MSDGEKKANLLNQQFASVFTKNDSESLPPIPQKHDSMPAFDITDESIEKLLKILKDHKASSKLYHYGIEGNVLNWIHAFLSYRSQEVIVDGSHSQKCGVSSGVPQGSVLGPLLFLLFINDIPSHTNHSRIRLFADDCMLYRRIESPRDCDLLQEDLNGLLNWEKKWKMVFHPEKCLVLSTTLKKNSIRRKYYMRSHQLQSVDEAKYLGVTINNKLNWSSHIDSIVTQAHRKLAFLQRNISHCPNDIKSMAYFSLVRPKLEYAVSVWDPYTTSNIKKLDSVQRKAARFVTGDYGQMSSVTSMLDSLDWPPLQRRRSELKVVLFYKILNNEVDIALPLDKAPRETGHKFMVPQSRTNSHLYSYFPSTVRVWNNLPSVVASAETSEGFKSMVKTMGNT